MSRIEHPKYDVLQGDGAIEVRAYPAMIVAQTSVSGNRSAAVNQGFRILADYIFGSNDEAKKIAMTAPVMQGRRTAAASGLNSEAKAWTVRFVMPREWSRERLPRPRDQRVTLETVPAARFAAIRFSGFWRDASLSQKTKELEVFMSRSGLTPKSAPIYAFYNPPWTLPFFRRNEVLIEVAAESR